MKELIHLRKDFRWVENNNKTLSLLISNGSYFRKVHDFDELPEGTQFLVNYIGFVPVNNYNDEIEIDDSYETAIVYFVRSKMHEEKGDYERARYYENLYMREIVSKTTASVTPVSQPSNYSLL